MTLIHQRQEKPPSVAWDVSSEVQQDAFEAYHQSIADLYDVTGVAQNGKVGFRSRTSVHVFGPSVLGRGRSVAQTLSRGPDQIRKSGLDHISLIINFAPVIGDCDGQTFIAAPGSVQFRDLSRPSASSVDRIDTINLMIPRAAVPSWFLSRKVHGMVLPSDSPGGRLVASHLTTLNAVAQDLDEAEGIAAIEATFIIAERFLGRSGPVHPLQKDAIHRTIRRRAIHAFDSCNPGVDLDVAAVARSIGVSRSSLYRAFEVMGGVQSYVQRRRLQRAYRAVRFRSATASIADIGYLHGFISETVFRRAFKEYFGFVPDDISPLGSVEPDPISVVHTPQLTAAAHDVFLDWMKVGDIN